MSSVIRLHELPDRLSGGRAPTWWGMLLLITIEAMVFGSLFAGYVYLRLGAAEWPPPGFELPGLTLPLINTFVLGASSVAIVIATRALKRGDQRQLKLWLGAGLVLEIVFLAIKVIESRDFGQDWSTHAYGSIYWSINGLHTLHVIVAILMASAALVLALRGYYTPQRRLGMQVVAIYWQFVAVVWLPVFIVLYFLPRWF
jgi:cytochrome c oxidase subunit III